ncbi:GDSL-type esterase/lipase family protein [Nocardia sp. AG03]|uniref:GDSL-type esterase/lipase family protein n=1 Tax=Nocardia sp. AG03 TaxID=3025312 RepID=UPI0024185CC9|nr:GDSL-type esterase/lipase family protein [Nocardia sp. AG03]
MSGPLRLCFLGDSFVQGIGDPDYRGWVGRVLATTDTEVTAFNLGIRRNTSDDVAARCWAEVDARTVPEADNRIVLSFGSNDMVEEDGRVRVDPTRTLANLATLLAESVRRGLFVLVVGPPPVIDAGESHLRRTTRLAAEMSALCHAREVPFVDVTAALAADPVWVAEARDRDGAHPGSGGYDRLAALVRDGGWHDWISRT